MPNAKKANVDIYESKTNPSISFLTRELNKRACDCILVEGCKKGIRRSILRLSTIFFSGLVKRNTHQCHEFQAPRGCPMAPLQQPTFLDTTTGPLATVSPCGVQTQPRRSPPQMLLQKRRPGVEAEAILRALGEVITPCHNHPLTAK